MTSEEVTLPVPPERVLAEVQALLAQNRATDAIDRLSALINRLGPERLQLLSPDLRPVINSFFPKKQRELRQRLEERLAHSSSPTPGPPDATSTVKRIQTDYAARLDDLRDHHIFQWTTHYRTTVGYILKDLIQRTELADSPDELLDVASQELRRHSLDIFGRGFTYITQQQGFSASVAQLKSLGGLQHFLVLIIQAHTSLTPAVRDSTGSRALRDSCSALLSGVLAGYADADFGDSTGWSILTSKLQSWGHTLALHHTLLPLSLGLDRFFTRRKGATFLYTRLSRFSVNPYRLEFSLALPARANRHSLIILCY